MNAFPTLKKLFSPASLGATVATAMLGLSAVNVAADYYVSAKTLCNENPLTPCSTSDESCAYPYKIWCFQNGYPVRGMQYWCCAAGESCGYYHQDTNTGDCLN